MDPTNINTHADLTTALDRLRGALSYRALSRIAATSPSRAGRQPALPTSTIGDLLNGRSMPSADTVVTFLVACGVDTAEARQPWLDAVDRVAHEHQRRPSGTVRVRDARPRLLGVHAAIQVDPPAGQTKPGEDELPPYVPRDLDTDVRAKITMAGQRGGFVLLVGGSSVGKSRTLFEAVSTVLADWWLLHPADADAVRTFAATPTERTVVWLDELQNYLDAAGGLPAAVVRDLVRAGVVVVATLWPDEYATRTAPRTPGEPDPRSNDRKLLDLAEVVDVPDVFNGQELCRAEFMAVEDGRIRVALDTPDAGFTQVMAAGPELVRWWEQAPEDRCYGKAVITAVLDARRVGAQAPLTRDYLRAAAPSYLTGRQRATAPRDWLDHALTYATKLLRGATATLCPVPAGMGQVAGYHPADYLHQHALRVRRTTRLPDGVWHALIQHHHPHDAYRLADSAKRRARYREAEILYQHRVDAGDVNAARELARLLVEHERVDDALAVLRRFANNAGDWNTASYLDNLLAEQYRVEELTDRADAGDRHAGLRLAELFMKQSRNDEAISLLWRLTDEGDPIAPWWLGPLLAAQGQAEEAIAMLRPLTDAGNAPAADSLIIILAQEGEFEEAITLLRGLGHAGSGYLLERVTALLVEQGQVEEAITLLRSYADADDRGAASQLAELLCKEGRAEELTHRAEAGDNHAAAWLARLLFKQGRVEELAHRAEVGDKVAARLLTLPLAEQVDSEEAIAILRPLVDAGDPVVANRLATLLAEQGQIEDAIRLLYSFIETDRWRVLDRLATLLVKHGLVHEVITLAYSFEISSGPYILDQLAELIVEHGRIEDLEAEVAAGTRGAEPILRTTQSRAPNT